MHLENNSKDTTEDNNMEEDDEDNEGIYPPAPVLNQDIDNIATVMPK